VVWIYARDREELRCEVRPTENGFLLAISCPGSPEQLERFKTAGGIIARQTAIERRLQEEGWQLTDFYPTRTRRESPR